MRVAQVVVTKTQNGKWKVSVMSLNETVLVDAFTTEADVIKAVRRVLSGYEWEQLSLAV